MWRSDKNFVRVRFDLRECGLVGCVLTLLCSWIPFLPFFQEKKEAKKSFDCFACGGEGCWGYSAQSLALPSASTARTRYLAVPSPFSSKK